MKITKKVLIPAVLLLCALFFLGGFQTQKSLTGSAAQVSTPAATAAGEVSAPDTENDGISLLDAEHQRRRGEAVSNVEREEIDQEYIQRYQAIIDDCYDRLLSLAGEEMQSALIQERIAWESYSPIRLDMQLKYYQEIYESGSIVPVLCSGFEYDLYHQRAISFQKMYDEISRMAAIRDEYEQVPFTTESMNQLGFDVAPPDKSLIELASRTYEKPQLSEIAAFDGSIGELHAQYPIECIKEDSGGYRVSYLGDGSIAVLLFDELGNCLLGNLYGARRLKADFDGLEKDASLEDVRAIDPDGVYLFLETLKEDMPKASSRHCTRDGYLITIEYDASYAIMRIKEELI